MLTVQLSALKTLLLTRSGFSFATRRRSIQGNTWYRLPYIFPV